MPEQQPHSTAPEIERTSNVHQTPFYVLPTLEGNRLLTLPGGVLIRGTRNAVTSGERNANAIAEKHGLITKARGSLMAAEAINAYGYVVEPAWRSRIPEYADLTRPGNQTAHQYPLELHDHVALLARIESELEIIKSAKTNDAGSLEVTQLASLEDRQTARHLDSIFVRSLGKFLLAHH